MESKQYVVKGSALSNLKKYLESKSPGLFTALNTKYDIVSGQMILQSSWYDADSIYQLQDEAGRQLGLAPKEMAIEVSRHSLEVDLAGIYRLFMRIGGAEQTLQNSPKLANRYVNFFDLSIIECKRGFFRCKLESAPGFVDRSLWSNEGAITGILNVCKSPLSSFVVEGEDVEANRSGWSALVYTAYY